MPLVDLLNGLLWAGLNGLAPTISYLKPLLKILKNIKLFLKINNNPGIEVVPDKSIRRVFTCFVCVR